MLTLELITQIQSLRSLARELVEMLEHLETHYIEDFHPETQERIATILGRPEVKRIKETK